jgi:hypothetical protein
MAEQRVKTPGSALHAANLRSPSQPVRVTSRKPGLRQAFSLQEVSSNRKQRLSVT